MKIVLYQTVTGETLRRCARTGPKSRGFVRRLFRVSPGHLAALQSISAETGGVLSVNELVRRAIRFYLTEGLCNPVYTGLVKQ